MVLEDAVTKEHFNGYPVALFVQARFRPRVRGFFYFVSVQHNFVHKRDEIKLLMFL